MILLSFTLKEKYNMRNYLLVNINLILIIVVISFSLSSIVNAQDDNPNFDRVPM